MNVTVCFSGIHARGGVERVALQCVRHLASSGHNVRALCSEFQGVPGVQHDRIRISGKPTFLQPRHFFEASSCFWSEASVSASGLLNVHGCIGPLGGVHWVQSVHAAWLEACAKFYPALTVRRILQRLNPLHGELLRLERKHFSPGGYRRLIVTTRQVRDDLARLYSVQPKDVRIIPNGFDPSEFSPEQRLRKREQARRELALADNEIVLLMVTNELERKGYRQTIEALKALRREVQCSLVVVGRYNGYRALREAERFGVAEYVRLIGATSDVGFYHSAADIFVLPTQYEAMSLAILESLGSGLPVVTSDVPGAADAIVELQNGAVIDDPLDPTSVANAVRRALPLTRNESLSIAVARSVRHFQWPVVLSQYEAVLTEIGE